MTSRFPQLPTTTSTDELQAPPGSPAASLALLGRPLRVVHLPVYHDNAYQPMLMEAQRQLGLHVIDGGGGGNFLRTALRDWRPDVLHVHWLHPYLLRPSVAGSWARGVRFLAELALLRRRGARIVWTVHNLANHDQQHPRTELCLTRRFVRLCDAVTTHGEEATKKARKQFAISDVIPVLTIPLPNYAARYSNSTDRSSARKILGVDEATFVVTFLGRVEPYKQVLELIESFAEAAPRDSCLLISGRSSDANYSTAVRALAAKDERVRVNLDFVPDDAIQYYFNAADVVACTSRGILTSSSVLLAFSFSRPVIAPADGCIPEAVGCGGFLYSCGEMKSALRKAVAQRNRLHEMGVDGLAQVREATPERVAQRLVDIYLNVTSD